MKKIQLLYSLFFSLIIISSGCSKDGIDDDLSFTNTTQAEDAAIAYKISDDNSGNVVFTATGKGGSYFLINFDHAGAVSDTLIAGASAIHAYPEGTYNVSVTSFDLNKKPGATANVSITVTYKAPENVDFAIASDMQVSATADFANSFLVYYGDVPNEVGTPLALGATAPVHIYASGGPYQVKVVAISGNPYYAGAATVTTPEKQVWGFPIPFEDPNVNYFFGTFGNVVFSNAPNPAPGGLNSSATVGKYEKPTNGETWSGTYTPLSIPLNFAQGNKVKVLVYNPDPANIGKLLNVELEAGTTASSAPANGVAVLKMPLTTSGAWEELTFDFSTIPAIPATSRFGQLVLRFNDIAMGTGEIIYVDNFRLTN